MKKIAFLFVILTVILTLCACATPREDEYIGETEFIGEDGLKYTYGLSRNTRKYSYFVSGGNTIDNTEIVIPSTYNGITVVGIIEPGFQNHTNLKSIAIPDSVSKIYVTAFTGCTNLASINVDKNNPYYCSEDGVLFDKDKTRLMKYPQQKTNTAYTIPKSVTTIDIDCFTNCTNLTSITIPKDINWISGGDFKGCTSLTSINVDENNPYFCSEDGVVYDKDKTTIIKYPAGKTDTTYTIPESVTVFSWYSFEGCTNLKTFIFYHTVEQWEAVIKEEFWNEGTPNTIKVVCSNGKFTINQ